MGLDLGFIGDMFGGAMGFLGAEQQGDDMIRNTEVANQFSAEQVAKNREFQERMSNTSYQRGTEDMKAAGLNPMLAYSQGGASSPSGNAAQGIAAGTVNKLGAAVSSAQTYAQLENIKAQTDKTKAETYNIQAEKIDGDPKTWEANLKRAAAQKNYQEVSRIIETTNLTMEQKKHVIQQVKNAVTQNRLAELDIPKAINEAKAQGSWYMKEVAPYTGELGKLTNSAAQIRGMGRSAGKGLTINNNRR